MRGGVCPSRSLLASQKERRAPTRSAASMPSRQGAAKSPGRLFAAVTIRHAEYLIAAGNSFTISQWQVTRNRMRVRPEQLMTFLTGGEVDDHVRRAVRVKRQDPLSSVSRIVAEIGQRSRTALRETDCLALLEQIAGRQKRDGHDAGGRSS